MSELFRPGKVLFLCAILMSAVVTPSWSASTDTPGGVLSQQDIALLRDNLDQQTSCLREKCAKPGAEIIIQALLSYERDYARASTALQSVSSRLETDANYFSDMPQVMASLQTLRAPIAGQGANDGNTFHQQVDKQAMIPKLKEAVRTARKAKECLKQLEQDRSDLSVYADFFASALPSALEKVSACHAQADEAMKVADSLRAPMRALRQGARQTFAQLLREIADASQSDHGRVMRLRSTMRIFDSGMDRADKALDEARSKYWKRAEITDKSQAAERTLEPVTANISVIYAVAKTPDIWPNTTDAAFGMVLKGAVQELKDALTAWEKMTHRQDRKESQDQQSKAHVMVQASQAAFRALVYLKPCKKFLDTIMPWAPKSDSSAAISLPDPPCAARGGQQHSCRQKDGACKANSDCCSGLQCGYSSWELAVTPRPAANVCVVTTYPGCGRVQCGSDKDCCNSAAHCDTGSHACCAPTGGPCFNTNNCCSGTCSNGKCD